MAKYKIVNENDGNVEYDLNSLFAFPNTTIFPVFSIILPLLSLRNT